MYGHDVGQDMILFNNSKILIEDKSVRSNKWIEKGVLSIHDMLHDTSEKSCVLETTIYTYVQDCR